MPERQPTCAQCACVNSNDITGSTATHPARDEEGIDLGRSDLLPVFLERRGSQGADARHLEPGAQGLEGWLLTCMS